MSKDIFTNVIGHCKKYVFSIFQDVGRSGKLFVLDRSKILYKLIIYRKIKLAALKTFNKTQK